MSSKGNSTGSNGTFPIGFGNQFAGLPSSLGGVEQLQLSYGLEGNSAATLTSAATAVARVQEEIDLLWRDSMRIQNEVVSQTLVEVSHALQRAARLLQEDRAIG